jgi:hypothetical protein
MLVLGCGAGALLAMFFNGRSRHSWNVAHIIASGNNGDFYVVAKTVVKCGTQIT